MDEGGAGAWCLTISGADGELDLAMMMRIDRRSLRSVRCLLCIRDVAEYF